MSENKSFFSSHDDQVAALIFVAEAASNQELTVLLEYFDSKHMLYNCMSMSASLLVFVLQPFFYSVKLVVI